jgi:N-acetylmuramoyl-L-alanine amidase
MSIFNKGFAKFVKKQLDTRKAILSNQFYNIKEAVVTATGDTRIEENILGDNSRNKNYLNYQSKTPFVRLTSGVDIPGSYEILAFENDGQDKSAENEVGIKLAQMLGTHLGSALASNFVLEGGSRNISTKKNPNLTVTTISSNIDNNLAFNPTPTISNLKKGFDILGADSTYGKDKGFDDFNIDDPDNIINTSGDEFGIRPMPGITNVVINSRSTTSVGLKGLRECTISIKCHSLAQLQVIELLYMRPGYTALLEWGHSVYFVDNDINTGPTQNIEYIDIFNGKPNRFKIYDEIFEKKCKSRGNYDAILGKVNNFSWTADDNGGYDITVNIISMNDIIDSLKINQVVLPPPSSKALNNGSDDDLEGEKELSLNAISFVFGNIYKRFGKINNARYVGRVPYTFDALFPEDSTNLKEYTRNKLKVLFPKDSIVYNQLTLQITNPNEDNKNWHNYQVYITFNDLIKFINSSCIPWESKNSNDLKNKVIKILEFTDNDYCRTHPFQISVDPMVCLIQASRVGSYVDDEGNVQQQTDEEAREQKNGNELLQKYLSYEFLGEAANRRKKSSNGKVSGDYPQEVLDYDPTTGLNVNIETRKQVYVTFLNKATDLGKYGFVVTEKPNSDFTIIVTSPDGTQSEFATGANNYNNNTSRLLRTINREGIKKLTNKGNTITTTTNPTNTIPEGSELLLFEYGDGDEISDRLNNTLDEFYPYRLKGKGKNKFKAQMSNILININYIINAANQSLDSDGNMFLKDFMINLFKGIEQATGQINNFALTPYEGEFDGDCNPKNVEVIRIIDEAMMDADFENKDKYYEFPLLKYNSLITDYKLSSTISNAISYTVSIGAQNVGAGHAASGVNSVFNAFNQGIKDRLAEPIIDQVNTPKDLKNIEKSNSDNLKISLDSIYTILQQIKDNNTSFPLDTSQAKKVLNDYIGYYSSTKPSVNKLFYSFTPFPVSLSLTLDGISGIAVGSIIRLPTDRLPLLYRYLDPEDKDSFNQAKVAFIITGVDHTVDDRGWFTNLTCQMIMMPRKIDETKADNELEGNTKVDDSDKTVVDDEKPLDWDEDGGDDGEKQQGRNLPSPKSQPGKALDPNKVKYIVVHCTANGPTSKLGASDIRRFHLSLGWDDIGYHYIIKRNGTIEKGRDISRTGAHTYGYNSESVGVSYVGGIDNNNQPQDNRTAPQKQSLIKILTELKQKFPNAIIQGHRDFAGVAKACPCFDAKPEYQNI